jgi:hypothetical protein
MLQAILQAMLQGAGPVGHYPKLLEGVLLTVRFVTGSSFLVFRPSSLSILFLSILFLCVLFLNLIFKSFFFVFFFLNFFFLNVLFLNFDFWILGFKYFIF